MTRIKTLADIPETTYTDDAPIAPRRQTFKRTPQTARLRTCVRLGYATLRRWHADLDAALASPRGASTAKRLTDLQADLTALLGDALHGDITPPVRKHAIGYIVTQPDGEEVVCSHALQAAQLMGVTVGSMRVMLSEAGGQYSRTYPTGANGGLETWSVRRNYAASAPA